jgi:hypothetical protein
MRLPIGLVWKFAQVSTLQALNELPVLVPVGKHITVASRTAFDSD